VSIRVGINGFGRMGRLLLRAAWQFPEFEFVHINEPGCNSEISAHLLEYDSLHGRWPHSPTAGDKHISIDGKTLSYSESSTIEGIPWQQVGVDLVFECTGVYRSQPLLAAYFDAGIKKVVVAAPVKDGVLNVVMGINDELYNPADDHIVTAASCTTNCLAPIVKVIHEGLGIRHGVITTIHDVTNTQTVVDRPHKDPRRARSSLMSLIPTTTGSATAIGLIFPELLGKLNGVAVRVPLLNASLTDCVFELKRETTVEEVNALFKSAAESSLSGILGYETKPLVSVDYVNDPRSCIIDAPSTMVVDGTQLKVLAWYDNEIGYVHRMAELGQLVANSTRW